MFTLFRQGHQKIELRLHCNFLSKRSVTSNTSLHRCDGRRTPTRYRAAIAFPIFLLLFLNSDESTALLAFVVLTNQWTTELLFYLLRVIVLAYLLWEVVLHLSRALCPTRILKMRERWWR